MDNMVALLAAAGACATVPVYQDPPLYISETRIPRDHHEVTRDCDAMRLVSAKGVDVLVIERNGRSWVIREQPFSRTHQMEQLVQAGARRFRVDFLLRHYEPDHARKIWSSVIHSWRTA